MKQHSKLFVAVHGEVCHVQFSPLTDWVVGGGGGHEGRFSRNPLPVFPTGDPRKYFWHGQGCPLFDVHSEFFLLTTASTTLQGALKDGFGEIQQRSSSGLFFRRPL